MREHRTACALIFLLTALVAGCNSMRVHSETREKQSVALKSAWETAAVNQAVALARQNLAGLQKEQAITSDRLTVARRAAEINAMAAGGTVQDKLFTKIDATLIALADSPANATSIAAAAKRERDAKSAVSSQRRLLQHIGIEVPDCAAVRNEADVRAALAEVSKADGLARGYIRELIAACGSEDLHATEGIALGATSRLAQARAQRDALQTRIGDLQKKTVAQRLRYRAAILAYDSAKEGITEQSDVNVRITKALQDARAAFEQVDSLSDNDKYSLAFLSKERKAAIDRFFTAVLDTKDGDALPASASNAALFFRLFPKWLEETKAEIAATGIPSLQPLLMQRDFEKAQSDALEKDILSEQREIAVLDAVVALYHEQIETLVRARGAIALLGMSKALPLTFRGVFDNAGMSGKNGAITPGVHAGLLEAAGLYLDAQIRVQGEVDKLSYEQHYLQRERALIYAEASLNQWSTLIGGSIEQLAAYGQGGIKPETLVSFINAVSLLWIGEGVN
ncbi:hypothetical protein OU994_17550 [Pseudoduganella sp. SL102]|uniref:hypothetical protein n=1 Tax=Pseudoduganella sp. SL102 TaxID=2995154 RepID=UPI00248CF9B9|nr:hypothetical protein [Pseudoduganella sp. SL102]WBS00128.1 hypothetical protein OU994_17550 [Pseudoduganella sp. SL102]